MEGNGYYPESEQGYGDGWGTSNRRNTASTQGGLYSSTASTQGGLYGNEAYMQRGLYYDASASYGSDLGGTQRMSGYTGNNMAASQRMSTSTLYGTDMGSQRMAYTYGEMDVSNSASQRDTSYGSISQPQRRQLDYDANAGASQNTYQPRDATTQKRMLSSYESDMALLQGGSYAGSAPYGKDTSSKRRNYNDDTSYTSSQQGGGGGGSYNSLGQKGSVTYKAVAPPEVGAFAYEYDKFTPKRQFGLGKSYESGGSRSSGMFDDTRYRLGTGGNAGVGGGRGRGRGRGRGNRPQGGVSGGDNWQNKGQKRNESGFQQGGPWPKKKKNPVVGLKNPVSFLNEIRPDTGFEVSDMEGPSNMPTFTVSLEFDGEKYTSSARSKKLAKRYVAEAALKIYLQTPAAKQLGYMESQIEFSNGPEEAVSTGNHVTTNSSSTTKKSDATATKTADDSGPGGKNPVMFLNELRKDAVYDLKEETGQAHNKNFIMRVTVTGQEFEGTGQSKKLAKASAAREALKGLGLATQE